MADIVDELCLLIRRRRFRRCFLNRVIYDFQIIILF
jgi:hypothetical protein